MQFCIMAYDGEDADARERRMAARKAHIALSDKAIARGEQLVGAALLDEDGNMRGSVMIVEFPSRQELDAWLAIEPYVTCNVWQKIEVMPCRLGPSFSHCKRVAA